MADFRKIWQIGYVQAFKAITVGHAQTIFFTAIIIYIAGFFVGGLTGILISIQRGFAILFGKLVVF